jgi:hypothetical protein
VPSVHWPKVSGAARGIELLCLLSGCCWELLASSRARAAAAAAVDVAVCWKERNCHLLNREVEAEGAEEEEEEEEEEENEERGSKEKRITNYAQWHH